MKILLAGGAGFIGSVLAPILIEHGYEVEVIDLLWFGNNLPKEARVIEKDLFDCKKKDIKSYDQVVFLGGLSNDPMAEFSPAMNFTYNAALPSYLSYLAREAGVRRFIYASSCSVYGYTVNEMFDEQAPVTCAYPYGISKLQGERGVLQMKSDSFSTIAIRQGTVCGYSARMRFDLVVNTMFKSAVKNGKITINNPSIWRPIIDVRDTSAAFLRAIQSDYAISGIFNVAGGNYTVGQLGDLVKDEVEQLLGKKIALEVNNIQDFRNYKVSCEQAKTYLGFNPKYSISDTVKSIYQHLDSYGDFENENFHNILTFRKLLVDAK